MQLKQYKYSRFLLAAALVVCCILSCSKEKKPEVDKKEDKKAYVSRADSARLYSGRNRLLLTWPNPDPKVTKAKVYWNSQSDSLVKIIDSGMDSVKIYINDLAEGKYTLEIFTFDKDNNSSGKVLVSGIVYGEVYADALKERVLRDITYQNDKSLKLRWADVDDAAVIGSQVFYTDAGGSGRQKFFAKTEAESKLDNMPAALRGEIKYRTVYAPSRYVIDTLFSGFTTVPYVNRKAVFDSLPGWKFRCKVMAEAKTIEDYGGPIAFKAKMDEAMIKASRKFQVPGLNDAGGNQIHFYMSEMIPFEGMSKQFRYVRGVDDDSMDILLIVNHNDGPDDLAWGWLRAPYLTLGHNYTGLFGSNAVDALLHEFGHARGMYDLYLGEVPKAANNPISGQAFESKKCIMNYPYGETEWSEFSRFIINESAGGKVAKPYWNYFPNSFSVTVKQKNGTLAQNAKLNFYPVFANSNAVRENDVIKYRGTTGTSGTYNFPDNPYAISGDITNNVYNYLVQVEYNGKKEYRWMPMDDALIAGSKGQPFSLNITLNN